jgi:trans-2,3-dihydro-3-hydroxyanthranilate isomerase
MTGRLPFYFVDVFATRPLTGNPLSLVPDADGLDMDQSPPQFGAVANDRAGLAACLGLDGWDLLPDENARVVSTGAAHLLVPAGDRGAVDRAAPDPPRLESSLRQVRAEGCYLYSRDPVDAAGAVA